MDNIFRIDTHLIDMKMTAGKILNRKDIKARSEVEIYRQHSKVEEFMNVRLVLFMRFQSNQ